jgi:hypothetical protein
MRLLVARASGVVKIRCPVWRRLVPIDLPRLSLLFRSGLNYCLLWVAAEVQEWKLFESLLQSRTPRIRHTQQH